MMFEIKTEEVEIKGEKYRLRPLSGRFLPKLYSVMAKFQKTNKDSDEFPLDEEATKNLHDIALATFQKSYPNEKDETLDDFVSQNLLVLLETLIRLNIGDIPEK